MVSFECIQSLKRLLFGDSDSEQTSLFQLATQLRVVANLIEQQQQISVSKEENGQGIDEAQYQKSVQQSTGRQTRSQRKGKGDKVFDFGRFKTRLVALKLCYLGWDYQGFAQSQVSDNSIESNLFEALVIAKLIPANCSWQDLKYTRCGRTDKGVSSAVQIVSLEMRSQAKVEEDELPHMDSELDYPALINAVLTDNIRVVEWAPIDSTFNARFGALWRHYRYFLVSKSRLNVTNMQTGMQYLLGEHDFRNMCKMDIGNVKSFVRKLFEATVEESTQHRFFVYTFNIRGTAFLWRQVRAIVGLLQLIGQGFEEAEVVKWLLNLQECPAKPQFELASADGLVLYDCGFEGVNWQACKWKQNRIQQPLTDKLQYDLTRTLVLQSLIHKHGLIVEHVQSKRPKKYVLLKDRVREPTIEERQAKRVKSA